MQEQVIKHVILKGLHTTNFLKSLLVSVQVCNLLLLPSCHALFVSRLLLHFVLNLAEQVPHLAEIIECLLRLRLWCLRTTGSATIHINISTSCLLSHFHDFSLFFPDRDFLVLAQLGYSYLRLLEILLHQTLIHEFGLFLQAFTLPTGEATSLIHHFVRNLHLVVSQLHGVLLSLRVCATQLWSLPLLCTWLALTGRFCVAHLCIRWSSISAVLE